MAQDSSFWNSDESVLRYADMEYKLYDTEELYIKKAAKLLGKRAGDVRILDVGCGGGRSTVPLYRAGYDVTGVDISPRLIASLKSKFPEIKSVVGDVSKLDFSEGEFDIALFSHNGLDCLYPYESRKSALLEVQRVLGPGGFFIFSSHVFNLLPYNRQTLKNTLFNWKKIVSILLGGGFYNEKMSNGMEVKLYASTCRLVEKELSEAGFSVLESSRIVNNEKSWFRNFAKGLISWERYYLTRKV